MIFLSSNGFFFLYHAVFSKTAINSYRNIFFSWRFCMKHVILKCFKIIWVFFDISNGLGAISAQSCENTKFLSRL